MKKDFGNRMKVYEEALTGQQLLPLLPAMARLDGKCFHNFTKGMNRPFDARLSRLMIDTTKYLVQETNACMGYTQSDEISLAWLQPHFDSQIFFAGKIQKMVSVLASMCTAYFNQRYPLCFWEDQINAEYRDDLAMFDCRVWNVPNIEEGANVFLWREQDATKNSVQMAARHYFSHKELQDKNGPQLQEMLFQVGVNWNDYPNFFKRGVFVQRRTVMKPYTFSELKSLSAQHEARKNSDLLIERSEYVELAMPPFGKVQNRAEVIFFGAEPQLLEIEEPTNSVVVV
ncbi:MAG: tRNA(His) guanylyltransferase Thg1 family protein [Patescibacteria group bacterium]|nr:tRNA(His) guanylyltransferase Thg1 family protein [Patescibacteria group bacterium]